MANKLSSDRRAMPMLKERSTMLSSSPGGGMCKYSKMPLGPSTAGQTYIASAESRRAGSKK